MDEILIEEKKYVSSKQAAKLTGYAKDYVGQLCREGRVPARLVGRSWYVLESAIQDHRFGNQEATSDAVTSPARAENEITESSSAHTTSEFPKYEASYEETLPTLNRMRDTDVVVAAPEEQKSLPQNDLQSIHESWKEWFDTVREPLAAPSAPAPGPDTEVDIPAPKEYTEISLTPESTTEDVAQSIPLHVVKPQSFSEEYPVESRNEQEQVYYQARKKTGNKVALAARVAGLLLAVASVIFAAVGSGYFDTYLTSGSQAPAMSGVYIYNK